MNRRRSKEEIELGLWRGYEGEKEREREVEMWGSEGVFDNRTRTNREERDREREAKKQMGEAATPGHLPFIFLFCYINKIKTIK